MRFSTNPPAIIAGQGGTPPPTGFNTFTDGNGNPWISYNGSPWQLASNGLHCRVYRNAAYTTVGSMSVHDFDSINYDTYHIYQRPNFVVPLPGIYHVQTLISSAYAANLIGVLAISGMTWGNVHPGQDSGGIYRMFGSTTTFLTINYSFQVQAGWNAIVNGQPSQVDDWCSVDYLGTG